MPASSASWKTSSSQVWIVPPSGGMPRKSPARTVGTARMSSGATIVGALSWMCRYACRGPRHGPQKVMKIMRNV
jgi:hypothetical protein